MKKSTLFSLSACLLLFSSFEVFSAELDWARVGTSGKSIIFLFKDAQDAKGAGVNAVSPSLHPTITINGTQKLDLTEAIDMDPKGVEGDQALPYVIYPLFGTVLKAGDKVTVSAPDGWVTCGSGAIGALQDVAVENYAGKSLFPPPPDKYTMQVGFNLSPEEWGPIIFRANLMREPAWYMDKNDVPVGANGLPTAVDDRTILHIACALDALGDYTLLWDGGSQLELENPRFKKTAETLTGDKDNKRIYTVTNASGSQGGIDVRFLGTDVHHVRLYPPGVKTDGSQYFLPQFLQMVRGAKCIRYMQGDVILTTNLTRFDQLRTDEEETRMPSIKVAPSDIVSVEPYDNKDRVFPNQLRDFLKITTAQPHHLQTGYSVKIVSGATVPMTSGRLYRFIPPPYTPDSFVYVLSPTEFAIAIWDPNGQATAKEKQAITGTVDCKLGVARGDMWLSEVVDLVNSVDGCDLWISVPDLMEDDSVGKMFAYIGKRLKRGRKVHVEYSNEVWNWAGAQCAKCQLLATLDPDPAMKHDFYLWYMKHSIEVQTIAKEEFQKLGRQGDILGVIAWQTGQADFIHSLVKYANSVHASIDEYAVAPYYDLRPNGRDAAPGSPRRVALDAITKKLDVDQTCDIADMNIQYGCAINSAMQMDVDALKRYDFQGKLVCYEGGAQSAAFTGEERPQKIKMSEGWASHPRIGPWMRYFFQRMQDNYGVSLFNYFTLNQGAGQSMWGVYPWRWDQVDGKGDGSEGLFNNLSDLQSDKCVSVKGYWMHDWLDHLNQESSPESKP